MQLILLTHSREVSKKTNTGQLVQQLIPNAQTIIWQRALPDKNLLQLIASENTALVYPAQEITDAASVADFDNFILIDSTWQEARKIYNRSPYLQQLPKIQLFSKETSKYNLRRNQVEGGLCTVECVIEVLKEKSSYNLANEMSILFSEFISIENSRKS